MSATEAEGGAAPHLDPEQWGRLIHSIGLDSVLVVIRRSMGDRLSQLHQPEDLLQDTLVHAWRDRHSYTWQGLRPFKAWLLGIARNRVRDAADRATAQKRGTAVSLADESRDGQLGDYPVAHSPTPGEMAVHRERSELMLRALASLAPEHEVVVRMHLFEERPMREVAAEVGVPEPTCWARFRRGVAVYAKTLHGLLRESTRHS